MNVKETSGIELLRAMKDGQIPPSPIADTVPMRIKDIESGSIRFVVKADKRHTNPLGGVHGGFAATVLDSVMGCAIFTTLEPGVGYTTIDLNIKMIRPIPFDVELFAEGRSIHVSKSLGVSDGHIKDSEGNLYAHGTCTCMILRP